MKNLTIRPFNIDDYENVVALWQQAGLPCRPAGRDSRKSIEKEILQDTCYFFVAETGGRIIGTILGTQDGRKGWINRLAVDKDFRRRKTAQILLNTVEKQFKMDGLEVYACLIEAQNDTSMKFFEKSGYYKSPGIVYYSKRKNGEV